MTLRDILALWAGKSLPQDSEQLAACRKVMEQAFDVTLAAWESTTDPVTGKMLNRELETYEKVIWAINRRQLVNILQDRQVAKAATVRRGSNSTFYLASRVL